MGGQRQTTFANRVGGTPSGNCLLVHFVEIKVNADSATTSAAFRLINELASKVFSSKLLCRRTPFANLAFDI